MDNMSSFTTEQIPKGSMCINTWFKENLFVSDMLHLNVVLGYVKNYID